MSTPQGTPRARPTQPPLGPSLSTHHRSPYPTALRPSLFNPRPSPLASTSLSPATALATQGTYATPRPLAAASRLRPPQNTPSSAYSSRLLPPSSSPAQTSIPKAAPGTNPFDVLPASAFDSFVSSLTTSIRSALQPVDSETPSQRRKREREERQKEREEARAQRAAAQKEREERAAREEEEQLAREAKEQDVFGEIIAVADQEEGEREEARSNEGPYGTRENTVDEVHVEDLFVPFLLLLLYSTQLLSSLQRTSRAFSSRHRIRSHPRRRPQLNSRSIRLSRTTNRGDLPPVFVAASRPSFARQAPSLRPSCPRIRLSDRRRRARRSREFV